MRTCSLAWLLFLCSATAAAHEESFDAVWIQPLAPIIAGGLIIPVGLTHGLAPGADLSIEITPYAAPPRPLVRLPADVPEPGICAGGFCRLGVYGLIATLGVAIERPFFSSGGWTFGAFLTPKALVATAIEPGGTQQFVPGASYELGGGVDVGIEVHGPRPGFYASIVFGWQVTRVFNYGGFQAFDESIGLPGLNLPPSWPVAMMMQTTFVTHGEPVLNSPNLNLIRIGWVF